ncbi:MAG: hypothetical protein WA453_01545, partial [Methyloceanibacter sp.]
EVVGDAEGHVVGPDVGLKRTTALESGVVELVELGVADPVSGSNLDAVTGSSHPNHCALMCDDLAW